MDNERKAMNTELQYSPAVKNATAYPKSSYDVEKQSSRHTPMKVKVQWVEIKRSIAALRVSCLTAFPTLLNSLLDTGNVLAAIVLV